MTKIGYARVSTTDQDTSIQEAKLTEAGCTIIRREKVSGKSRDGRTELDTVMQFLRAGDVLVVTKLDRLGRSTRDVLNLIHEIEQKGASLQVIEPAIDTSGTMGKVMVTVIAMVAEMELNLITERRAAGIAAAKKVPGKYKGGTRKADYAQVRKLVADGLSKAEVARRCGISRETVYQIIGALPDAKWPQTKAAGS